MERMHQDGRVFHAAAARGAAATPCGVGYGRSKASQVGLPAEEAIDADEARAAAPHFMLLQPTETPGELRYVAVGSAIVERFGSDLSGALLRPGASGPGWVSIVQQAAERRPLGLSGRLFGSTAAWAEFEVLALPLSCVQGERAGISVLVGPFFFGP